MITNDIVIHYLDRITKVRIQYTSLYIKVDNQLQEVYLITNDIPTDNSIQITNHHIFVKLSISFNFLCYF